MRKLYQIGLYFKPGLQVHVKDLAGHLCASASDVSKVVLEALDQQSSVDHPQASDLPTTMTAAGRVVAGILAGSQKLVRMPGGEALVGKVTYALVQMYGKLLTGFETISKAETTTDAPTEQTTDGKTPSAKQKPKAKGGAHRVNIRDVPATNALASLLSGIMRQLDAKQDSHRDLFEGFVYSILSKLGNRIYTVNFSQPRAASVAASASNRARWPRTQRSRCPRNSAARRSPSSRPARVAGTVTTTPRCGWTTTRTLRDRAERRSVYGRGPPGR